MRETGIKPNPVINELGFNLYLLFTISWFLHLGTRIQAWGEIRGDLILVVILFGLSVLKDSNENHHFEANDTSRMLKILCLYIVFTIPFVQWPGSAIFHGLPNFIKAIVFYYFTVAFVSSNRKLNIFITVFILCQCFRIYEPLYMHIAHGYWGGHAYMSNGQFMTRLNGAPSDIVGPNGLAFLVDSVIPFLYYLSFTSKKWLFISIPSFPAFIYALVLTGSRSGLLGLIMAVAAIWYKSDKKTILTVIIACGVLFTIFHMNYDQKDRYLSIVDNHTMNSATAKGRFDGVIKDFKVAFMRPIFGHGIGTSLEANYHYTGDAQPAHNLYSEVAEELGFVGLFIYLLFIKSIFSNFARSVKILRDSAGRQDYLRYLGDAMQVWLLMNTLFSFASYGLSDYEWYLFAGFSVVLSRLAAGVKSEKTAGLSKERKKRERLRKLKPARA